MSGDNPGQSDADAAHGTPGGPGPSPKVSAAEFVKAAGAKEVLRYISVKDVLQHVDLKKLVDGAGVQAVLDRVRVSDIIEHIGVKKLLKAIPVDELPLDSIRVSDIVDRIGAEKLLKAIPFPQLVEILGTKRLLDALPMEALIDRVGIKELLAHVSLKALVDATGRKNVLEHLTVDDRIDGLEMSDARVLERVLADPQALAKLFADDRAVRASLVNEGFRKRSRAIDGYRVAGRLPYALPVPVVSFPRAGSNFLQSVLQASSGLRCQSIYVSLDDLAETTLTVKSHSPSPEYLMEEWGRFLPDLAPPAKAVVLLRDPRDQMISFLEYTRSRRETAIDAAEFLDGVDYFFASTIDRTFQRHRFHKGLTIAEAYRFFVDSWVRTPPNGIEILQLRYEDLLTQPQATFQRLFDFLALDCELAREALQHKISLYGDSGGRERGVVRGWEKHYAQYAPLVDQVHTKLREELALLGYDGAAPRAKA